MANRTVSRTALIVALPLTAILASCGDDLESRQEAAESNMEERALAADGGDTRREAPTPAKTETAGTVEMPSEGDEAEEEAEEEIVIDAAPDDLIDSAQGFAPEPMDDARGFDPTPMPPEEFDE